MNFERTEHLQRTRGMVLLAVLVVLMVITLAVTTFSQTLERKMDTANILKQRLLEQAVVQQKTSELIFTLATQRQTPAGISRGIDPQGAERDEDGFFVLFIIGDEYRTDGFEYIEVYEFQEQSFDLSYRIQNQLGLIGINSKDQYWLQAYLDAQGLFSMEVNKLRHALVDYADADSWPEALGAESRGSYQTTNYLLQTCSELKLVRGWEVLSFSENFISKHCSTHRTGQLNLNSVPLTLWRELWPQSAEALASARANGQWMISQNDTFEIEPSLSTVPEEYLRTMGNTGFSINVQTKKYRKNSQFLLGKGFQRPITPIKF